ncbi:hypothetical protein ACRJ4W_07260 [Streptomyces sp. GLT-R25]
MTTGLDLLAEGGTITLTDGTEVPLRYSFRALALLEARFGSVGAVQTAIDSTGAGAASSARSRRSSARAWSVRAGSSR